MPGNASITWRDMTKHAALPPSHISFLRSFMQTHSRHLLLCLVGSKIRWHCPNFFVVVLLQALRYSGRPLPREQRSHSTQQAAGGRAILQGLKALGAHDLVQGGRRRGKKPSLWVILQLSNSNVGV